MVESGKNRIYNELKEMFGTISNIDDSPELIKKMDMFYEDYVKEIHYRRLMTKWADMKRYQNGIGHGKITGASPHTMGIMISEIQRFMYVESGLRKEYGWTDYCDIEDEPKTIDELEMILMDSIIHTNVLHNVVLRRKSSNIIEIIGRKEHEGVKHIEIKVDIEKGEYEIDGRVFKGWKRLTWELE